tara:strand:+ start:14274 stop:15485 length:1212 start_codon:yes stop_codon:yes gene_type:complete
MNVAWVIDNKFRDLYGLKKLKDELRKKKINLKIINKYHWKYAIRLFDPHYVVLPNAYETCGLPILKFCKDNKIKSILHNTEGFHTDAKSLKTYFPKKIINDFDKIFVWCDDEKKYLIRNGILAKKIIITGSLRYQNKLSKKFPKKIRNIGILSSNKFMSGRFGPKNESPIIRQIFRWSDEKSFNAIHTFKFMHYELDFIKEIKKIIFLTKKKYNFILRPHPFEDSNFYNNKNFKVDKSYNISKFLSKVDLVLNHYSSASIDALLSKVPIISLEKILNKSYKFKDLDNFFPIHLAFKPKNVKELEYILKSKFFLKKYELSYQKKFEKIFFKYHPIKNGIEIIKTNLIFFEKKRKFNFFNSLILFILYEVYYFFKYNRETAFRFYLSKDKKLLEEFSLNYEKNTK